MKKNVLMSVLILSVSLCVSLCSGAIKSKDNRLLPKTEAVGETSVAYGLKAGVAKRNITVDAKGVRVNDPLYAKALVLDDGVTKLAIVAMDAVAIGGICDIKDDFLPNLRGRIERELRIPKQNVLVNASHTHPPGRLLCDDAEQISRTFEAVKEAQQNMTAVTAGSGTGHEDRIMMNRRLRLKNGTCWTIRHANPCPPNEEVTGVGPIDPEIGILRFDRLDGSPLAVIYNFACHPYIGVPRGGVTADYPGFASKVIEENLGPDVMALFLQGAGGDITEVLYKDVNRPRDAEPLGVMLGLSTLKGLADIQTEPATLTVISETVDLPRKSDFGERIDALQTDQADLLASLRYTSLNIKTFLSLVTNYGFSPDYPSYYSYRYLQAEKLGTDELSALDAENRENMEKYLSNIYAMEKLARIQDSIATLKLHETISNRAGGAPIPSEVQGIRIGDCVIITSQAELLVEVGLNIKKASPYLHTFVAAFSNGYIYYGPPAGEYDKGGYEVVECQLAPQWQEIYEKKASEIIRKL